MGNIMCSTPSGINVADTRGAKVVLPTPALCSTPSGINVADTIDAEQHPADLLVCSTPSGINVADTSGRVEWYTPEQ